MKNFLQIDSPSCINLFYNNARSLLLKTNFFDHFSFKQYIQLTALLLQATYGNFTQFVEPQILDLISKTTSRGFLTRYADRYQAFVSSVCKEWSETIKDLEKYECVCRFLISMENSNCGYGLHYFPLISNRAVGNKKLEEVVGYLGIGMNGIFDFDASSKVNYTRAFSWEHLESLFHKDNKFTIEVAKDHVQGNDVQFNWFGSKNVIQAIWYMAIHQHRFFVEQLNKSQKVSILYKF